MQTLVHPSHYYSKNIFSKEQKIVFENTWNYVGLIDDLKNHHDYICLKVANQSIIVINFQGELRAFRNVCSHRFSRIINQDKGNGPLQCQYHGWAYNSDGVPYAIPQRKCFKSISNLEQLRLDNYQVAICGRFIFVRLIFSQETLEDYLGKMYQVLLNYSEVLNTLVDSNEITIKANWKIVVENTLEDYHVRSVHPNSLYKLGIEGHSFEYCKPHSATTIKFKTKIENNTFVSSLIKDRDLKIEDYQHHFIFPNLTIASAYGTTVSIQKIIPINSRETLFYSSIYTTSHPEEPNYIAIYKAFGDSARNFNHQVFDEDKSICEQVQLGLEEASRSFGVLHDSEERVYDFQKNYLYAFGKETS